MSLLQVRSVGKWSSHLVHTQKIVGSNPAAATSFASASAPPSLRGP